MPNKETLTIKTVHDQTDWYHVQGGSMGFGIKKKYGVEPKVGDEITLYTKGFSLIRGIDLNGVRLFYKTDEELEQDRKEWLEKNEQQKQEHFLRDKDSLDKQYNSLPDVFKRRIDRFRANNPRFRIDYESYELFCCTEAVLIAGTLKTPEAIEHFKTLDWKEQKKMVPNLSSEHSGNTFGCAVALAFLYLKEADTVERMHGSLSPLVGSEAFGDIAPEVIG